MTQVAASAQPLLMDQTIRILEAAGTTLLREQTQPLWLQLKRAIASAIDDRRLPPDSHLPSEHTLCRLFGVSRTVVREALAELANEGSIVKIKRRGVFVARPKADQDFPGSNIGFHAEMTAKGYKVTSRIFSHMRGAPTAREREMLALPPGAEIVRLRRLAYADGRPGVLSTLSLPAHRVPGLESIDLTDRSLYATLRERYGLTVRSSERWLDAVLPTGEQAELLEITPQTPVIAMESVARLANGQPIEYYTAFYNSRFGRIHIAVPTGQAPADAAPVEAGPPEPAR